MFGKTIRSRVLEVIDSRLEKAETDYKVGVASLKENLKKDMESLAEIIVKDVLGPLA